MQFPSKLQTYDFSHFSVADVLECSDALSSLGTGAQSMEEVTVSIVNYFRSQFADPHTGEKSCALARFYKTTTFADLDINLRGFARSLAAGHAVAPETKCLTLMATAGEREEWNDREKSLNHQAIPLLSEQVVAQSPMISQLIEQMGLQISDIVHPDPALLIDTGKKSYNVFYVPHAPGSPSIPAQEEFVLPYGIQSVLGFGGMLPSLDLFTVILFSKMAIPAETATLFKSIALAVRGSILPFTHEQVFTAPLPR